MIMIKTKYSKHWPIRGFYAINWFGIIHIRKEEEQWTESIKDTKAYKHFINHESLHSDQAEDIIKNKKDNKLLRIIGYAIFYILYGLEWLIKLLCKMFYLKIKLYYSISFEQEAYKYQSDLNYRNTRKRFANYKYLFKFITK